MLIVDDIEQKRLPLTFSLTMLRERIQRLLNFCSPAAVPTEWNVQLEVESEVFNDYDLHFCLSLSLSVLIISVFDCSIVVYKY